MAEDDDVNPARPEGPRPPPATAPRPRRKWGWWLLAALAALVIWNATVALPVGRALSGEDSHSALVYRRWLISPSELVFDVWSVSDTGSMADMDRLLFKAAEALEGREFDSVVLAYRGAGPFRLEGRHFGQIGESWPDENPIYLVRTLPEHVSEMDGTPAFGAWTGGWLGVLNKQMEDHNELHQRWYVRPSLGL